MAERAVLGAQDELGADDVRRQPLLRRPDVVVAAAAGNLLHLPRLHVAVPCLRVRLRPPLPLLRLWAGITCHSKQSYSLTDRSQAMWAQRHV